MWWPFAEKKKQTPQNPSVLGGMDDIYFFILISQIKFKIKLFFLFYYIILLYFIFLFKKINIFFIFSFDPQRKRKQFETND